MTSQTIPVEQKLLGTTVALSDGSVGTIKELRPNRPWYCSVETDGQTGLPVHFSKISIGGQKLSDYLISKGIVLNRNGWSSLVRANDPNSPLEANPADQASSKSRHQPSEMKYHAGRIKWFGGKNSKTGKTNPFGFITSSHVDDFYFHLSAVSVGLESLSEKENVVFSIAKGAYSKLAADSVHVVRLIQDMTTLRGFFIEGTDDARSLILNQVKTTRSSEWFIKFANEILEYLLPNDFSLIYHSLGLALVLSPEARPIRCKLAADEQLSLFSRLSDLSGVIEDVIALLESEGISPDVRSVFWRNISPKTPKDRLFRFAPTEVKRRVCRDYYAGTLQKISSLFGKPTTKPTSIPAPEIYGSLSEADRKLAGLWQYGSSDHEQAKMLSARSAELAARHFYAGKGFSVQDIATLQTEGTSGDWRTHDLLLNGEIPIDVKNSRCPTNNANFYVEHTVPQFKVDRRSKHVRISGILSPYLQLEFVNAPDKVRFEMQPIRFLGETSWPEIESLIEHFSSEKFEVRSVADRVVPHWLFDYPDAWYRDYVNRVVQLRDAEWPSEDEWPLLFDANDAMNVVPQLCAIGSTLPSHFQAVLPAWQTLLYQKIQLACPDRPHLPSIFLIVLTGFLEQLQAAEDGYSPRVYKSFLYGPRYAANGKNNSPLGLIDPVGLIDSLCSSLEILWEHRHQLNLGRFKNFRFSGLGLLQGREGLFSQWETILAYCGGREYRRDVENNVIVDDQGKPSQIYGKCGKAPLVLGREKLCESCHKLICSLCGFCSQTCEQERFKKLVAKNRRSVEIDRDRQNRRSSEDVVIPAYAAEDLPLEFYEELLNRM